MWNGDGWTKWFAGADFWLDPLGKWKHNLNAIWIGDTKEEESVFSLTQDNRKVPGISGNLDGMDLLRWDGDALSLYFDGQDVSLNVKPHEKIDGLHILP